MNWLQANQVAPESAMALVGDTKLLVPLGSFINKGAELARLKKEIEKVEKEITKARGKLANKNFIDRAPKQVVDQEQKRVEDFETALVNLRNQRNKVEGLPQ